jgi:hypothetical protein
MPPIQLDIATVFIAAAMDTPKLVARIASAATFIRIE